MILPSWFRILPSPPLSSSGQKPGSDRQFPSNTPIIANCPRRPRGFQTGSTDLPSDSPPSGPLLRANLEIAASLDVYGTNQTSEQIEAKQMSYGRPPGLADQRPSRRLWKGCRTTRAPDIHIHPTRSNEGCSRKSKEGPAVDTHPLLLAPPFPLCEFRHRPGNP